MPPSKEIWPLSENKIVCLENSYKMLKVPIKIFRPHTRAGREGQKPIREYSNLGNEGQYAAIRPRREQ